MPSDDKHWEELARLEGWYWREEGYWHRANTVLMGPSTWPKTARGIFTEAYLYRFEGELWDAGWYPEKLVTGWMWVDHSDNEARHPDRATAICLAVIVKRSADEEV